LLAAIGDGPASAASCKTDTENAEQEENKEWFA
jgi:hypothetical protein